MQYLGGKKRLAKHLVSVMQPYRADGQRFVDVFAGSLPITAAMGGVRLANDGCVPLINLYKAWQNGWRPEIVTEEKYHELKERQDPEDPYTAFAGFGLSYGGKWYGGFARNKRGDDYFGAAVRGLAKYLDRCRGVIFTSLDFSDVPVSGDDLVYLDPPYRNTTKYGYFKGFDFQRFDTTCEVWAAQGSTLFLSEYTAPSVGWKLIWEIPARKDQLATGKSTEKLFRWVG